MMFKQDIFHNKHLQGFSVFDVFLLHNVRKFDLAHFGPKTIGH